MQVPQDSYLAGRRAVKLAFAVLIIYGCATARAVESAGTAGELSNPGAELVMTALGLLGVGYRFGGNTPAGGLDCSGLVRYVFHEALGQPLPRRSEEMGHTGRPVRIDQLRPGDLVFFDTLRRTYSHVGIYIGNRQFVHAPSTGSAVRVESLDQQYWMRRYNGARRVLASEPEPITDQLALNRVVGNPEFRSVPALIPAFRTPY
jgi:cell wall-associated NlpC family hydrolase